MFEEQPEPVDVDSPAKKKKTIDLTKNFADNTKHSSAARSSEKPPRIEKMERVRFLVDVLEGRNPVLRLVPPLRKFSVAPGEHAFFVERAGVSELISRSAVRNAIMKWAFSRFTENQSTYFNLSVRDVEEVIAWWSAHGDDDPRPADVRWADEPGLCFSRLPWQRTAGDKIDPARDCPNFFEFMTRCQNSYALMLFIGSLFVPESYRQQYVWLYGAGANGKSAVVNFLCRVFGQAAFQTSPPNLARPSPFWNTRLLGKRLVVFPDTNNRAFVTSGEFKSLSGGDRIPIEYKGKEVFDAEINTKFIFVSNEKPNLSSEKADTRRAIYCEVAPMTCEPDANFSETLWAEGGRFLSCCIALYERFVVDTGSHGALPVEDQQMDSLVHENEEDLQIILDTHFTVFKSEADKHRWCTPREFGLVMSDVFAKDKHGEQRFRRWIERTYGVVPKNVKVDGKTERRYQFLRRIYGTPSQA